MDNLDNSLFISLNESQIRKSNNNLKFSTNYSIINSLRISDRKIETNDINIEKLNYESLYTENILNGCSNIINHNFQQSLNLFQNALINATKLNDEYKLYESKCYIGISYFYLGNLIDSLNILEEIYKKIFEKCVNEKFSVSIKIIQMLIKVGANLTIVYFSLDKNNDALIIISNMISIIERECSLYKQISVLRNLIFILFKVNSLVGENKLEDHFFNLEQDLNTNEKRDEYKNIINTLMNGFNNYLKNENIDDWINILNNVYSQMEKINDYKGLIFILFNQECFKYIKECSKKNISQKNLNECKIKMGSLIFSFNKNIDNNTLAINENQELIDEIFNNFKQKMLIVQKIYLNIYKTENTIINALSKITPINNDTHSSFYIKLLIKYSLGEIKKSKHLNNNLKNKLIDQLNETLAIIDNKSYDLSNINLESLESGIIQNLNIMFENLKYIYLKCKLLKYLEKFREKVIKSKIIIDNSAWRIYSYNQYKCIIKGDNIMKINLTSKGKKIHNYQLHVDNDVIEIFKKDKSGGQIEKIIDFFNISKILFGIKSENLIKKEKILFYKDTPWYYLSIIYNQKSLDWEFGNEEDCKKWYYGLQNYCLSTKRKFKVLSTTGFVIQKLKMKANNLNLDETFVQLMLKALNES